MVRATTILLCCLATVPWAAADEDAILDGSADTITSDGWAISGLESSFALTASSLDGEVRMARITLTASGRSFDDVRVACTGIEITTRGVACGRATFTATFPGLGRRTLPGSFTWDTLAATARIVLPDVAVAGGRLSFDILADDTRIEASYSGRALQIEGLLQLAGEFTHALADYSGGGQADVNGRIFVPSDGPLRVAAKADLKAASLANEAGTFAAADVTGRLDIDLAEHDGLKRFDVEFESRQGEAYLEPVYSNFSEHALRLRAENVRTSDFSVYEIGKFEILQPSLLDASGTARLEFPPGDDAPVGVTANVTLRDSSIANLYTSLVQVQLAGTVLGNLETDGLVSGTVRVVANTLDAALLELDDTIIDDRRGRFSVYGLSGVIGWHAGEETRPPASRLAWDSGSVYGLIVGSGDMHFQLGNNDIELLKPVRLPTMGGALRINHLALYDYGDDRATGHLDAELEPVQLGQLTGALGWPAFSGKLSGRLPLLQLAEESMTVGGDLKAQLFDGTLTISNLRIEQPFGRVPRLYADVAVRDLDLLRVTEVFSFGDIQGRLSGDVKGLELQNWRPVAMDMYFYTPADDRSQHRISQRAVDNLARVGGGASAALSTGMLRFFEVFAYDRIGLRCILQSGVCAMSGVGPARAGPQGTGYYIVKGRGVPRIDVVGYRDTVSWPRLVKQLSAITRGGTPAVN